MKKIEFFRKLFSSFDNNRIGYSSRKLSALNANIILLGLNSAYCWNGISDDGDEHESEFRQTGWILSVGVADSSNHPGDCTCAGGILLYEVAAGC